MKRGFVFTLIFEFRGILGRVANRLHVHPSVVSRVARGQRESKVIEDALRQEVQRILDSAGLTVRDETAFWG
jgi:hypothetical protein